MFLRRKIYKKLLVFILVVQLLLNPVWVRLAWAEGEEAQATPTPEFVSPAPTTEVSPSPSEPAPTEEPILTPTPEQTQTTSSEASPTPSPASTITTGDASAESDTQTTLNKTEDTVPGQTTGGGGCTPPEGQTTCPEDINIDNNNSALATQSATAEAGTGSNESTGSAGDATITTGDATASGKLQVEANTNIVTLEPSSTAPSGEPTSEVTPTPKDVTLTVSNDNSANVQNTAGVSAATGQNVASENLGDAKIETGDALALVNVLNILNTNIVNSSFEMFLLDIIGKQNNISVDLNELWKQILAQQGGNSLTLADGSSLNNLSFTIFNQSQANLVNDIDVAASTGGNEANNNAGAEIKTGDAVALANVTNIVNTNIFDSKFLFGIINIFGDTVGDIILPRPERFFDSISGGGTGEGIVFANQNQAEITNSVSSSSETGGNTEGNNGGSSLIETGNADSRTNSFTLVNLNFQGLNFFTLLINRAGTWQGKIFHWSAPGSAEEPTSGGQVLQTGSSGSGLSEGGEGSLVEDQGVSSVSPTPALIFANDNQALVKNDINVSAVTGGNEASGNKGDAGIETGNARASANLLNMINLNVLGGRWFLGIVTILGNWSGNFIFAYPDLAVTIERPSEEVGVGELTNFLLKYENIGHDVTEENARLSLLLPSGVSYISDASGLPLEISGRNYSWTIGKLKPKQGGSFAVTVKINDDFNFEEEQTFWSKIVPQVHAAENEKVKEIKLIASIQVSETETDLSNNTASVGTLVYAPSPLVGGPQDSFGQPDNNNDGVDHRQPKLEITAQNNVNEFVYLGDIVTFEVTVKNTSDVPSYNTVLTQKLYNGLPDEYGTFNFDLGTIQPGKQGKLSFGLKMNGTVKGKLGFYHTVAQAFGKAADGGSVSSNEARTDFELRKLVAGIANEALAAEEEKILGIVEKEANCKKEKDILAYVLLLALSSTYLTNWAKLILQKEKKDD